MAISGPQSERITGIADTIAFAVPASGVKDATHEKICPYDQRTVFYAMCNAEELQGFMRSRNIPSGAVSQGMARMTRSQLAFELRRADDHARFTRFFDLSPELRNQIYELYMAEHTDLRNPAPPSITRTCKQIRDEALEMFYATATLCIAMYSECNGRTGFGTFVPHGPWKSALEKHNRSFLHNVKGLRLDFVRSSHERTWNGSFPSRQPRVTTLFSVLLTVDVDQRRKIPTCTASCTGNFDGEGRLEFWVGTSINRVFRSTWCSISGNLINTLQRAAQGASNRWLFEDDSDSN